MRRLLPGILLILLILIHGGASAQSGELNEAGYPNSKLSYWAYEVLNLPDLTNNQALKSQKDIDPIIIAVIDDAFRLTHKDLKDFIYQNPIDRDNNGIDDDRLLI